MEEDEEDRLDLVTRMLELMDAGKLEGWYADLDLYEDILGLLCEDPEKALVAEQMLFDDLQVPGLSLPFLVIGLQSMRFCLDASKSCHGSTIPY